MGRPPAPASAEQPTFRAYETGHRRRTWDPDICVFNNHVRTTPGEGRVMRLKWFLPISLGWYLAVIEVGGETAVAVTY
jgi:hypothetical protein